MNIEQSTAAILAALLGLLGGLVATRAMYQQKSDELFFKALDFLGGGSQKRNLGIAAIELYWSNKRHRPICVSLLIGSALYLLLESEQGNASHEQHNLERIMAQLTTRAARTRSSPAEYGRLLKAIQDAQASGRATGLQVPLPKLIQWEAEIVSLGTDLDLPANRGLPMSRSEAPARKRS